MFICDFHYLGGGGVMRLLWGTGGEGAQAGGHIGEGGAGQTLERMMEMMRLQGEQLQIVAPSSSDLRKEVEDLKSGKGKVQLRVLGSVSCRNLRGRIRARDSPLRGCGVWCG